jgi:hypothetical protein
MLAMKAHHSGMFIRLQRGTAGEIADNQRGLGRRSVVVIIVNRERFLTGRWHLKLEVQHDSLTRWRQWLDHPERSTLRNTIFQVHIWIGAMASMYILVMGISGSIIVFRNFAPTSSWMAGAVKHVHGTSHPVFDGTGKLVEYLGTAADVTEQVRNRGLWKKRSKRSRR